MSLRHFYSFIILLGVVCRVSHAFDVAIYGATPGGIAAAITAARKSLSFAIAIIEPSRYIGGMATAGGIGLRDLALEISSKLISQWFTCFVLILLY